MSESDELERLREQRRQELSQGTDGPSTDEATATPSEPIYVEGGDHFEEVVSTHDVVLVDFHADWCGPCQMIAPVVEELAAETDAAVAKVDVDANQMLAGQYRVQGVPTLLLFADGEPVERVVGVRSKDQFESLIARYT